MSFKNDLCCQTSYYKLNMYDSQQNIKHTISIENNIAELKESMKKGDKNDEIKKYEEMLAKKDKNKTVVVHKQSKEQKFLNIFKTSLKNCEQKNFSKVVSNINNNTIILPQKDIDLFNSDDKNGKNKLSNDQNYLNAIDKKLSKIKRDYHLEEVEEKENPLLEKLRANQIVLFSMIAKLSMSIPPNICKNYS